MSQPELHKLELESQFILRLPLKQAESLRHSIRSGEPLSKKLTIKFDNDVRHGYVRYDKTVMPARLYDLPTIIESYKTLDRKNFYKTADISQILICKEEVESDDSSVDGLTEEEARKAKYEKLFATIGGAGKREFLYPHGITPPLKNVRKRRFRKTLRKKYIDFSEIEKEVKRLFKFDCDAIETRYEIVEEDKTDKVQPTTFNNDNAPSPLSGEPLGMQSAENSQNIDIHELFGDESSSSAESADNDIGDEDDNDDDLDAEQENDNEQDDNMDFEDQEDTITAAAVTSEPSAGPAQDIAAELAAANDLITQNDDNEERREELNRALAKIRERIEIQETEMRGLDNQALRMRLQPVLDSLHDQELEIRRQLDDLDR